MLTTFNKGTLHPVKTPATKEKLIKNTGQATNQEINQYQQYVGSLLYLGLKTRIDIAFTVQNYAKYASNPSKQHYTAINRIFAYLNKNKDKNIGNKYNCNNLNLILKGYLDSDWVSCLDIRRSITGYIFTLLNNPISWNVQIQKTVALLTCEAEYMALAEAIKEGLYLNNIIITIRKILNLKDIVYNKPVIYKDNNAALKLANNPEFHKRSKHIDIKYHFIRDIINKGLMEIVYINTKEQLADPLTKAIVSAPILEEWRNKINLTE